MIENTILSNLLANEEFARRTLPFIKPEYFGSNADKIIFEVIKLYIEKYNATPTIEALKIDIDNIENINETTYKEIKTTVDEFTFNAATNIDWLVDQTENFCQDKAIFNAIKESISILDGNSKLDKGMIPEILSDALSVSFDTSIGHSFLDDFQERYEFYHNKVQRIPFDIDYLNKITRGGVERKSLNILLGGTGVGKTLVMCHMASANLMQGLNVLYITMEMSEKKISQRIECNLMDITVDDLEILPNDLYIKKINKLKEKTKGKLIVKEYPTTTAGAANFRHLLRELKIKRNFIPDIIYVDYLNICCSSRMKMGGAVNSYTLIKAIAEEIRGLAVEFNVPIISATQTNRDGYNSSDVDLTNTAESFGLPATADLMLAIVCTDELDELNQMLFKQLKNRYNDGKSMKSFVVGIDRSKMRLYDVEESAQEGLHDGPVMDSTEYGERRKDDERGGGSLKIGNKRRDFSKLS